MRVTIGPYRNWVGPYQISEKILFWMDKNDDRVHDFGTWLSEDRHGNDSWLLKLCLWIESKKKRKIHVRIDNYDTWSMYTTLSHIILPMLKQLRDNKMGSPCVDDEDVPWYLRSTIAPGVDEWDVDLLFHKRWEWIMDEMIWTFEQFVKDDWECAYFYDDYRGYDSEGAKRHQEKINNGMRLFGKYYQGLWD
jgi:hypothetical protein